MDDGDQDYLYVAGTVAITSSLMAAVSAGDVSSGDVTSVAGRGINVGLWYGVLPRTRIYGLFSWLDRDQGGSRHLLSLGFAQDFSL